MKRLEFIDEQMQSARQWTKRLINEVPESKWYIIPEVINSSVAWQTGHLIISQYYHAIAVISGKNEKVWETIPLKEYLRYYDMDTDISSIVSGPSPGTLKENLDFVNEVAREELFKLHNGDLDHPLEPTRFPHPVAKTKYEALTWCFKHEMWHCGLISMIKRVLGNPTSWS